MTQNPTAHALMLRDTVIELRLFLDEQKGDSEFQRGYQMGLEHALDMLKHQCDAFGLPEDLGWMQPDVTKWLKYDD